MIDIARAQQMLDELKGSYIDELPAKFEELELLVLKVKKKDNFEEDMGELHRKVHSLKGSSGTHGLNDLSKVCHRLEDYLKAANEDKSNAVSLEDANRWIAHIDLMRKVLTAYQTGEGLIGDIEDTLDELNATQQQVAASYSGIIVDQSKANAMMYQNALSALPIKFVLMTDGYNALDVLLNNKMDLLVTSMELRKLNGVALISAVKLANGVSKDIQTILVTSNPKAATTETNVIAPDKILVKSADMRETLLSTTKELLKIDV